MRRHVVVLLSGVAGIACTSRLLAREPVAGSWISQGYGLYFEVAGEQVPVCPKSDLAAGRDAALEKALELLAGFAGRGANNE